MGFKQSYSKTFKGTDYLSEYRKDTILPFFGFQYSSKDATKSWIEGGELRGTIKDGEITFRRDPLRVEKSEKYEATFQRNQEPTEKAREIENRFYNFLSTRPRKKSPYEYYGFHEDFEWNTRYIYTSLSEYIKCEHHLLQITSCFGWYGLISGVFFGSFGLVSLYQTNPFLLIPVGACILGTIIPLVTISLIRRKTRKTPLNQLSPKKLESLRNKYFKYMVKAYGVEGGNILKEYAILKGYDKR